MQLKASNEVPNVSFRNYFQVSMGTDDVFVSEALVGKGFGQDAIVSISKSFYFQNEDLKSGLVQGSLNLTTFERIIPDNLANEISYVITGRNDRIIYASSKLYLDVLKPFNYREKKDLTFKNTGLVELTEQNSEGNLDYFLTKTNGQI